MASSSSSSSSRLLTRSPTTPSPSHRTQVRRSTPAQRTDSGDGTTPLCYCEKPSTERVSWTPHNPGRRFWNCSKSLVSAKSCSYFEFKDDPLNDPYYKRLLLQLKAQIDGPHVAEMVAEKQAAIIALEQAICLKEHDLVEAGKEVVSLGEELTKVREMLRVRDEAVAALVAQVKVMKLVFLFVLVVAGLIWRMKMMV